MVWSDFQFVDVQPPQEKQEADKENRFQGV